MVATHLLEWVCEDAERFATDQVSPSPRTWKQCPDGTMLIPHVADADEPEIALGAVDSPVAGMIPESAQDFHERCLCYGYFGVHKVALRNPTLR